MFDLHPKSYESIFQYLDDYTIYCHYIGEELTIGQRYSSPLREKDDYQSFSLYFSTYDQGRIYFKDHATGHSGNVFKFISLLFNIPYVEALSKIDNDFLLGLWNDSVETREHRKIENKPIPKYRALRGIKITSKSFTEKDVEYWNAYYISKPVLEMYNIASVAVIHFTYGNSVQSVFPKGLCFAYRIGKYYKIYQPENKLYKFVNNYPSHYIEGFEQLQYNSDTLIVTKSMKDVMELRVLGYESVSPKSENTVMPGRYFDHFREHYKNIYVLFDNDGKHSAYKYPFKAVELPNDLGKDISDLVKAYGLKKGKEAIEMLIHS